TELRMANPRQALRAGELHSPEIDFRLIPEFHPVLIKRVLEINAARCSAPATDPDVIGDRTDGFEPKRLLKGCQHNEAVPLTHRFDFSQQRCVATAHQLYGATITRCAA